MKYRLFTPGPTSVPPQTLAELAKPVSHHRTPEFRAMFADVQSMLRDVFRTSRPVHTITGSGTAAFEAGFTSTLRPGQRVLNVSNGKFAERWASYAKTFGMELVEVKLPYGEHVSPERMAQELKTARFDAVVLVHSETSTATVCDLADVAKAVRASESPEALIVVDGITSIGALPFEMDAWGVDVAITGSQKSLMLPPGLGFVALSERAMTAARSHGKPGNFYFDLLKYEKSLEDSDTPFTPANTLIEAQRVSLAMIRAEGLENVWKRTAVNAGAFRAGMATLGLELFSKSPADSVSAIRYPAGVDDKAFRGGLKKRHNVHVAGGQGTMEGSLFRVNHMGYTDAYDTLAVVAAIEHTLKSLGHAVELGRGVSATQAGLATLFG